MSETKQLSSSLKPSVLSSHLAWV